MSEMSMLNALGLHPENPAHYMNGKDHGLMPRIVQVQTQGPHVISQNNHVIVQSIAQSHQILAQAAPQFTQANQRKLNGFTAFIQFWSTPKMERQLTSVSIRP